MRLLWRLCTRKFECRLSHQQSWTRHVVWPFPALSQADIFRFDWLGFGNVVRKPVLNDSKRFGGFNAQNPVPQGLARSDRRQNLPLCLRIAFERIPEIYRDHQSIKAVAQNLDLSEDPAKQRLSRERKVLQEQFVAFVAGALKQTTSGKIFTHSVLGALPLLATTAKAANAGATAGKRGAMAKATGLGAVSQAIPRAVSSESERPYSSF